MYDSRDNRFRPTKGFALRFNQDVAGLGGDSQFLRHELRGDYYIPVYKDDVILKLMAKGGHIFGLNDKDVRINERFFIGGSDIRGFRNAGIGPRDITTRDALGGNRYYTSTVELDFPLGLPEELGFRGSVFADAGTLTDVDDTGPEVVDEPSIRASTGVGVSWGSPLGPIRIDVASPLVKEKYDREQQFRISFGTKF
jgi:outer membrane protein insertion porin family